MGKDHSPRAADRDRPAVILYTIEGGGHTWPGGKHLASWMAGLTTDEISASELMWEFYSQHPMEMKQGADTPKAKLGAD
jgi:poly(3-hydroxybutyrate) depolymerase